MPETVLVWFDRAASIQFLDLSEPEVKTFHPEAEPLLSAPEGKRTELRLHILRRSSA